MAAALVTRARLVVVVGGLLGEGCHDGTVPRVCAARLAQLVGVGAVVAMVVGTGAPFVAAGTADDEATHAYRVVTFSHTTPTSAGGFGGLRCLVAMASHELLDCYGGAACQVVVDGDAVDRLEVGWVSWLAPCHMGSERYVCLCHALVLSFDVGMGGDTDHLGGGEHLACDVACVIGWSAPYVDDDCSSCVDLGLGWHGFILPYGKTTL